MSRYSSISDDFYVNMNLNTEMDLPNNRDTVLHFFEQLQKRYPDMRNFYCRDGNEFVLEEEKASGQYRWTTVETRRVLAGHVNPPEVEDALDQHTLILDSVPYLLSISPLECESLNLMFGFDFTYRGNHNQLITEALGVIPAFEKFTNVPGTSVIANEPSLQFSLDDDCRIQARVSIETRTTAYHVRTGEFPEEQLSVYLTARRFGSLDPGETYVGILERLKEVCFEFTDNFLIDSVLLPLQQTIAIK
jgi:hypothetical protein